MQLLQALLESPARHAWTLDRLFTALLPAASQQCYCQGCYKQCTDGKQAAGALGEAKVRK